MQLAVDVDIGGVGTVRVGTGGDGVRRDRRRGDPPPSERRTQTCLSKRSELQ